MGLSNRLTIFHNGEEPRICIQYKELGCLGFGYADSTVELEVHYFLLHRLFW